MISSLCQSKKDTYIPTTVIITVSIESPVLHFYSPQNEKINDQGPIAAVENKKGRPVLLSKFCKWLSFMAIILSVQRGLSN